MENEQNVNLLDMDLSSVDVSMPLLVPDNYDLRIASAKIEKTSKNDDMIVLDMVTIIPATSMKGEPLGAGIHVFDRLMTRPTGKATMDMVKRNLAALQQSVGISGPGWFPQLTGRTLRAKVGYEPEGVSNTGKPFRAKNTIAFYLKAGQ